MKCFIGLGSNLGDRKSNLERAVRSLAKDCKILKVSPLVSSEALTPPGCPSEWKELSYLNAAIEIEWALSPQELLTRLKQIENELGRENSEKWAPRLIDMDILTFGDESLNSKELAIPHPEIKNRQFVLTPLKHLSSSLKINDRSVLRLSRECSHPIAFYMGILNLTPDSFSDGGELLQPGAFLDRIDSFERAGMQALDLGAESTRPGATTMSATAEWAILKPHLELLKERYRGLYFKPLISVDTYHPETAAQALEYGIDIINDVSGCKNSAMLEVLKSSGCDYVLMHSLSVPADKSLTLTDDDPVCAVKTWAQRKIELLLENGISKDRIIFDPGIGFGKTAAQSWQLINRIQELFTLDVRLLVGHSRKSFLATDKAFKDRDPETRTVSLQLASQGVDLLRVHSP